MEEDAAIAVKSAAAAPIVVADAVDGAEEEAGDDGPEVEAGAEISGLKKSGMIDSNHDEEGGVAGGDEVVLLPPSSFL